MRKASQDGLYTSSTAIKIAGIASTQTLHNYVKAGIISPADVCGKARHLRWDFKTLVMLRTISHLREAGITIAQIKKVADELKSYEQDFSNSYLIIQDSDVLIVQSNKLVSALKKPRQLVMSIVLDLQSTVDEVASIIKNLAA